MEEHKDAPLPSDYANDGVGVTSDATHPVGKSKRSILFWICCSVPLISAISLILFGPRIREALVFRSLTRECDTRLAEHDLEGAEPILAKLIVINPNDPKLLFLAARTARRMERFDSAVSLLEKCQRAGGVTDDTRLEWDLLRVQQGDIRGIDSRLRQTIGPDHPDSLIVLEALARGYIRLERRTDALQACAWWIERQPEHPWPWLWRGQIFERMSLLEKATENYLRAVQNSPKDLDCRLALGGLYLTEHRPLEAAAEYERVLAGRPKSLSALVGMATALAEQGRFEEASPYINDILSADPKSPQGNFLRGRALLNQENPREAEAWFRKSLAVAPYDPEVTYQLAQALRALDREQEAAVCLDRVKSLRADYVRLDELSRQLLKSDDPKILRESGLLALKLGRKEEGLHRLSVLLAQPGDHRETHRFLSDYYQNSGDAAKADEHRRLSSKAP